MRHVRRPLSASPLAGVVLASFMLSSVAPRGVQAQRVAGTVVDTAGRAIVDADVILGADLRTRTDSTGAFALAVTARGAQRLRVRFIGFRPYETSVDARDANAGALRIRLVRMPQLLGEVRITDVNACERNTLRGFECRRAIGRGMYRDAGELRALRPSAWADMLDGIPSLRRQPVMTPDGLDWRAMAPPSRCLVEIFNGEDPQFDGHVRKVPVEELIPRDVVAIEYYDEYQNVPEALQRFAWPRESANGCSLLVYWLREAPARGRRPAGGTPSVIRRP